MHLPALSASVLRSQTAFPVVAYRASAGIRAGIRPALVNCNCKYTCHDGTSGNIGGIGPDPKGCYQNACKNALDVCFNHGGTTMCDCT